MEFLIKSLFFQLLINNFIFIFHFFAAISREENDETTNNHNHHGHNRSNNKMPYNGYSEEYLDRLETNGNIPADKSFNKRKFHRSLCYYMYDYVLLNVH